MSIIAAVPDAPLNQKAWKAARDFEAVTLDQFLTPIFATVDLSQGPFGGGDGEKTWQSMLVSEMGKQMQRAGGIGIAKSVYGEMLRMQEQGDHAPPMPSATISPPGHGAAAMTPLMSAGARLAAVLDRENAALAALDFTQAGRMLEEKNAALAELAQAQRAEHTNAADIALREVAARLLAGASENRRLLERAILVQGRVIGTIARAAPRALRQDPRGYQRDGGMAIAHRQPAMALSARA